MTNRIKELRKKNNLTLRELGKKVDMSSSRISQYETGKREPKLETWKRLADLFDVPISYLQGTTSYIKKYELWVCCNCEKTFFCYGRTKALSILRKHKTIMLWGF